MGRNITWDAEMDRKLFLAVLKTQNSQVDYTAVAKELATDDQPCTPLAIKKHLSKLKATITRGSNGGEGDDEGTPEAKGGSRKHGKPGNEDGSESPSKQRKTAKGKGGKAKAAEMEDQDDEETGANTNVKREDDDDDE